MSDDGVVVEKRNRGRAAKTVEVSDKEVKDTKKRGRPATKPDSPAKTTEKKVVSENGGEPAAKRGRGRPPKKNAGTKSKPKAATGKGRGRPSSKKVEKEESADENDEEAEDED